MDFDHVSVNTIQLLNVHIYTEHPVKRIMLHEILSKPTHTISTIGTAIYINLKGKCVNNKITAPYHLNKKHIDRPY